VVDNGGAGTGTEGHGCQAGRSDLPEDEEACLQVKVLLQQGTFPPLSSGHLKFKAAVTCTKWLLSRESATQEYSELEHETRSFAKTALGICASCVSG